MNHLRLQEPGFDSLESALRRFFAPAPFEGDPQALRMRVDVTENDQGYTVKADIPGVKKEDIHVRVDGNVVRIDAECKQDKETKGEGDKVLRSERYYGAVSRSFSLAQDVDDANVQARYADGVLTLELPKKSAPSARRIEIK